MHAGSLAQSGSAQSSTPSPSLSAPSPQASSATQLCSARAVDSAAREAKRLAGCKAAVDFAARHERRVILVDHPSQSSSTLSHSASLLLAGVPGTHVSTALPPTQRSSSRARTRPGRSWSRTARSPRRSRRRSRHPRRCSWRQSPSGVTGVHIGLPHSRPFRAGADAAAIAVAEFFVDAPSQSSSTPSHVVSSKATSAGGTHRPTGVRQRRPAAQSASLEHQRAVVARSWLRGSVVAVAAVDAAASVR